MDSLRKGCAGRLPGETVLWRVGRPPTGSYQVIPEGPRAVFAAKPRLPATSLGEGTEGLDDNGSAGRARLLFQ